MKPIEETENTGYITGSPKCVRLIVGGRSQIYE